MSKPKVQLKNVKTFLGHEGYGLNCDVWVNGVKCFLLIDEGNGGEPYHQHYEGVKVEENIKLLQNYVDTLPPINTNNFELKMDIDLYIDEIFNEMQKEKEQKKKEKLYANALVFGVPNANQYHTVKLNRPIAEIPKARMQQYILEVKTKYFKKDFEFFNTNLTDFNL